MFRIGTWNINIILFSVCFQSCVRFLSLFFFLFVSLFRLCHRQSVVTCSKLKRNVMSIESIDIHLYFSSFSWLKFTSGSVQWRQWREGTFTSLDFLSRIDFEFSARNDTDQISLMTTRVSLSVFVDTNTPCTTEHLPKQYILSKSANFYELWPSTFIKQHYWSTFIEP